MGKVGPDLRPSRPLPNLVGTPLEQLLGGCRFVPTTQSCAEELRDSCHRGQGEDMRRALIYLAVAGVVSAVATGVASSAGTPQSLRRQQAFAQHLQQLGLDRFMTAPAQTALAMAAGGNRQLGPKGELGQGPAVQLGDTTKLANRQSMNVPASGLTNVRVNNPSEDSHFMDQTTRSETAIGVHGSSVVVGFNDSQQTLLTLTAASNLTAYGYSTDGGSTFTEPGRSRTGPRSTTLATPGSAPTAAVTSTTRP